MPRGISKVATDLRAVIMVEVAERLRRSVAARRSAATKFSNEELLGVSKPTLHASS